MIKFIIATFLLLLVNFSHAQKHCNEDSIMTIKGKWAQYKDANMVSSKNLSQVISRIDKIGLMFRTAYPEPLGAEAKWYRAMYPLPLTTNGPQNYYFSSLYKYWYCNRNVNELMVAGETGTWGEVYVNSLNRLLTEKQLLATRVNNNDVYLLPVPSGKWNGYPIYRYSDNNFEERIVLISRIQQLPWKDVSQLEYLNALKLALQSKKNKSIDGYDKQIADMKKNIKEWEQNKDVKQSEKEELISNLKKGLEEYQQNQPSQMKEVFKLYDEKVTIIDTYINEHASQLHQPAIIGFKKSNYDDFNGSFDTEAEGGQHLVVIDPVYFDNKLPDYIPQVMVLRWSWNKNLPGIYFSEVFEKAFPFEKLTAMLDK